MSHVYPGGILSLLWNSDIILYISPFPSSVVKTTLYIHFYFVYITLNGELFVHSVIIYLPLCSY